MGPDCVSVCVLGVFCVFGDVSLFGVLVLFYGVCLFCLLLLCLCTKPVLTSTKGERCNKSAEPDPWEVGNKFEGLQGW